MAAIDCGKKGVEHADTCKPRLFHRIFHRCGKLPLVGQEFPRGRHSNTGPQRFEGAKAIDTAEARN
jgi:hypothetical protein